MSSTQAAKWNEHCNVCPLYTSNIVNIALFVRYTRVT